MSRHYCLDDYGTLRAADARYQADVDVICYPTAAVIVFDSATSSPQSLSAAYLFVAHSGLRRFGLRDRSRRNPLTRISSRADALRRLSEILEDCASQAQPAADRRLPEASLATRT